jgi:cytoskeletal protein CcmA (bactofilin family)
MKDALASVGKSIVIKGELSGDEDLTIEGRVEGTIELRNHVLTIGSNGHVEAQVVARSIVVLGHVTGNLTATEKVDIREKGSVEGDIMAPRVAIADGSEFRGSVDMQRKAPAPSMDQGAGSLRLDAQVPTSTVVAGNGEFARV